VKGVLSFVRSLCGFRLQEARQFPQLYDQVTEENSYILHVFEKNAHLVVQVRVWGEAFMLRRGGEWR
jgi:hypothetical protein